jgi:hypothetical protein
MYVRFPLSLRKFEGLLFERGIEICRETVRFWSNRFGPMFAGEIRRQRVTRRGQRSEAPELERAQGEGRAEAAKNAALGH